MLWSTQKFYVVYILPFDGFSFSFYEKLCDFNTCDVYRDAKLWMWYDCHTLGVFWVVGPDSLIPIY